MRQIYDIIEDAELRFHFNTRGIDAAPMALAADSGSGPTLAVYKLSNDSVVKRTGAEIDVNVDSGGKTGFHEVIIDTSADVFYEPGYYYDVTIDVGTVDGIDVAGVVLGTFSIAKTATVANFIETFLSTLRSTYKDAGTIGELFYRPTGSVVTGTSETSFTTDLTEATNDHWKDAYCLFTNGTLAGQMKKITGYNGTTKALTTNAFTGAPSTGDDFILVNL